MKRRVKNILNRICRAIRRRLTRVVPVYIPVLRTELLHGRTAIVTGGTRGIGFAIAKAFLDAGASVIITGRSQENINAALHNLRGYIRGKDVDVIGHVLDNTDVDRIGSSMDMLFGNRCIDILVNNAGVVGGGGFPGVTESDYDHILDANLKGNYFVSQDVTRRWIATGTQGNILNICSSSSLRPGQSPYILSKWGMRALTIGMAKSLIDHGIVVNGLAPGPTSTSAFVVDKTDGITWRKNPAGRLVTEEEVANLAVVLVSGLGRMVVGDILYVSGGAGVITVDDI